MNKYTARISILFSLTFFLLIVACNPTDEKNGHTDSTKTVTLENQTPNLSTQEYQVPSELPYGIDQKKFLYDKFYPIGWSEDGFFAYASEPADEASGYYFFTINVFDTKNNKIVWTWKIDESNEIEESSIAETWTKNYPKFKKELNKYKITAQKKLKLQSFPATIWNDKINVSATLTHTKDPYGFGFDVIDNVKIQLNSKKSGTKELLNESVKDKAFLNFVVLGAIKNPDAKQIIVLIKKEQRGYEGPPNVILFETIGYSF